MRRTRTSSLLLVLGLAGCTRIPDSYAPPIQRRTPEEISTSLTRFVAMNAPNAADHIVSGVVPELLGNAYRWTLQRPVFRFRVPRTQGMKLQVDLTISDDTFRDTGPVTIRFYVDDHLLGEEKYEKSGGYVYQQPVAQEWLTTERPVVVRMEVDKLGKSPAGVVERGFILSRLGFID
jgi:hypothetical protein